MLLDITYICITGDQPQTAQQKPRSISKDILSLLQMSVAQQCTHKLTQQSKRSYEKRLEKVETWRKQI
jgi:hypothetical protein